MSCARDNLRGRKSRGPLKMSLEMAHLSRKKIMSRSFLNSGTLKVSKALLYFYEIVLLKMKSRTKTDRECLFYDM
jgi:hypothetical protein